MKIIFLDIDGVLNYAGAKSRCHGVLGIEDEKLEILKSIVNETGAIIVLTSTWKMDWTQTEHIEDLNVYGQYMVNKFKQHGLTIFDKTVDEEPMRRGEGILKYLEKWGDTVTAYCIIDDETFDYKKLYLSPLFVKTSFSNKGIEERHARRAISILNERRYD